MLVANVRSHTSHGQVRSLARHSVSEAQVYFPEYESESATAGPVWMSGQYSSRINLILKGRSCAGVLPRRLMSQ